MLESLKSVIKTIKVQYFFQNSGALIQFESTFLSMNCIVRSKNDHGAKNATCFPFLLKVRFNIDTVPLDVVHRISSLGDIIWRKQDLSF